LNQLLARAASNGDAGCVQDLLKEGRVYLDLNAKDEDGSTPLIYAACFGHIDIVYALLNAGANVDVQDNYGWSALMWATTNNQDMIAKCLLDHGASTNSRSKSGRTVIQYVKHAFTHDGGNNEKLLEVFSNPRDNSGLAFNWTGDELAGGYYKKEAKRDDNEVEKMRRKVLESADQLDIDVDDLGLNDSQEEEEDIPMEFNWDMCYPGQMFVFAPDDIDYIVDVVVAKQKPQCSKEQRFTPANMLFLCARFAHYYGSTELLEQLLDLALIQMSQVVATRREVPFLAFWMTNCNQLLYYLKKDVGMVTATVEYQVRLSELVSEIYESLVRDVQRRLEYVIAPALLLHEHISFDEIRFEREHRRSFLFGAAPKLSPSLSGSRDGNIRAKTLSSSSSPPIRRRRTSVSRRSLHPQQPVGPRSVTALLSSTLFILQTYQVHPTLIHYTLSQLFYYVSAEVFNQILTSKGLCSRSKGMQIRYNVAVLEDWVMMNQLPKSLFLHLKAVVELLQYMQCMTRLVDLQGYIETVRDLSRLNALQVRLATLLYRYEVGERKLPEEIQSYVEQAAIDTRRRALMQQGQWVTEDSDAHTATSTRSVVDLDRDANGKIGEADVAEFMDPEHLLPFSLPTVGEMDVGWGHMGKDLTPTVPDNLMDMLDNRKR
jgi:hypothetical protein